MMSRMLLLMLPVLLLIASCSISPSERDEANLSRGKKWVRSNPFWISGLTQSESLYDVDMYRGAGLNTLLAWDPKPILFEKSVAGGLPIHYHLHQNIGETEQEKVEHVRELVEKYPGCTGVLFWDEPQLPVMEKAGAGSSALRKAFPDLLVYSNALPMGAPAPKYGFGDDAPADFYTRYIQTFGRVVQPDVMMIDIYPIRSTKKGEAPHSREYFENLAIVRQVAMKQGVPYWLFIQSYDHDGKIRRPSDSDLRFQLFTPLTLGFTGIAYFTYDPALGAGLIDGKQNRTPLYYLAARANGEVENMGQVLRFLDSTGFAFVLGRHEEDGRSVRNSMPPMPPPGPWVWPDVPNRPKQLRGIEIEGAGEGRNALVGFFKDDGGEDYFMITNVWHEMGMSAAACAQTITLHFSPKVQSVTRLSRETGLPEHLAVEDGTLVLRLPGGTGDLFKIGDGRFPGLSHN